MYKRVTPFHEITIAINIFDCLNSYVVSGGGGGDENVFVSILRYSEGLVDIKASSVEMLGEPKQVFVDAKTSTPT